MTDTTEFFAASVQLLKMTNIDTQYFVNYLSARLRLMSSIFFKFKWDHHRENVERCSKQIMAELVRPISHFRTWLKWLQFNTVAILGIVISSGRKLEVPRFLKRCMRSRMHLSMRYNDDDDDDCSDKRAYAIADHWFNHFPEIRPIPSMDILLSAWSRQHFMVSSFTAVFIEIDHCLGGANVSS